MGGLCLTPQKRFKAENVSVVELDYARDFYLAERDPTDEYIIVTILDQNIFVCSEK
jgi:hypothetical protein